MTIKKKFKAHCTMSFFLELDIEAENSDEAWRIARETDGGDWTEPNPMVGGWDIHELEELDDEDE